MPINQNPPSASLLAAATALKELTGQNWKATTNWDGSKEALISEARIDGTLHYKLHELMDEGAITWARETLHHAMVTSYNLSMLESLVALKTERDVDAPLANAATLISKGSREGDIFISRQQIEKKPALQFMKTKENSAIFETLYNQFTPAPERVENPGNFTVTNALTLIGLNQALKKTDTSIVGLDEDIDAMIAGANQNLKLLLQKAQSGARDKTVERAS